MKQNRVHLLLILLGIFFISSCQKDNYKLGDLIPPTNLEISFEIVGVDSENPYGDGSGLVHFTTTATNAITFNYDFGDGTDSKIAPGGSVSHVFSKNGVNTYTVNVFAIGTGGMQSVKSVNVEVFSSFTDEEAVQFLTGGDTKTWYWAADQQGHVGLGPNFVDGTNHTFAAWYNAVPYEKTCMYDAEFVFTLVGEDVTFEQTAGQAFIPGTYAGKIGVEGDVCHGPDVVDPSGVKNVSFAPANSIATIDGGYRGTSFTLSDGGFMSWWVGVSTYEIISITDNLLVVRVEEDGTFAWYQTLTATKPPPAP